MSLRWFWLLGVLAILPACAPLHFASNDEDSRAKSLKPKVGRALVYLYEADTNGTPERTFVRVSLEAAPQPPHSVGPYWPLIKNSYYLVDAPEGVVRFEGLRYEAVPTGRTSAAPLQQIASSVPLTVKAGGTYFVRVTPDNLFLGIYARRDSVISVESDSAGTASLQNTRLIDVLHLSYGQSTGELIQSGYFQRRLVTPPPPQESVRAQFGDVAIAVHGNAETVKKDHPADAVPEGDTDYMKVLQSIRSFVLQRMKQSVEERLRDEQSPLQGNPPPRLVDLSAGNDLIQADASRLANQGFGTLLLIEMDDWDGISGGHETLVGMLHSKLRAKLLHVSDNRIVDQWEWRFQLPNPQLANWNPADVPYGIEEFGRVASQFTVDSIDNAFVTIVFPRIEDIRNNAFGLTTLAIQNRGYQTRALGLRPIPLLQHGYPITPAIIPAIERQVRTSSRQPQLAWEAFPRPEDKLSNKTVGPGDVTEIVYDLRIWSVAANEAAELVYSRNGLTQPSHRVEEILDEETTYAWSIRARFKLHGAPRALPWSGICSPDGSEVQCHNPLPYRFTTPF
jgi:hypothetical protein